ncbi:MAG: hypothetical protein FJ134_07010 [Deltaproteobacteria bacterium]|nr:hypothetical protein [Deltaproteobacteria bacterium]
MRRKMFLILATVLLSGAFSHGALAGIALVGPPNPVPGFPAFPGYPQYYKDTNGAIVELPQPPVGDPVNPAPVPPTMIFDTPIAGDAFSQAIGFGTEAFYWYATARTRTRFGNCTFIFGLEATYLTPGDPTTAVVFFRTRVVALKVLIPGTYLLYTPFGVETIVAATADLFKKRGLVYTRDVGATPLDFAAVQTAGAPVTFLRATAMAPGVDPTQWLGDGVTSSTVTGSPIGYNKVRLEAPPGVNLDGLGNNFVETDIFTVSGKIPGVIPTALTVDRATYNAAASSLDVFVSTDPNATVDVINGNTVPPTTLFTGLADATGKFFAHIAYAALPKPLTVTASAPPHSPKTTTQNPVDVVVITQADYNVGLGTLTVTAQSSDPGAVLTATGFGPLGAPFAVAWPPPARVDVTSTGGGKDTALVNLVP